MESEIANPKSDRPADGQDCSTAKGQTGKRKLENRESKIESVSRRTKSEIPGLVFHDPQHHIKIYQGDCLEILPAIPEDCVDLIFADPPYFLSNDGIPCHAGRPSADG